MNFFFEQSNIECGTTENNLQLGIKVNKKELSNKNNLESTLDKDAQLSIKKFRSFNKNFQFFINIWLLNIRFLIIFLFRNLKQINQKSQINQLF